MNRIELFDLRKRRKVEDQEMRSELDSNKEMADESEEERE